MHFKVFFSFVVISRNFKKDSNWNWQLSNLDVKIYFFNFLCESFNIAPIIVLIERRRFKIPSKSVHFSLWINVFLRHHFWSIFLYTCVNQSGSMPEAWHFWFHTELTHISPFASGLHVGSESSSPLAIRYCLIFPNCFPFVI